jgi:hypothetical protein
VKRQAYCILFCLLAKSCGNRLRIFDVRYNHDFQDY